MLYFSQRNFKRRNIHRRRWLESDITIDNYSDSQVYIKNYFSLHPTELRKKKFPQIYDANITSEECQSQPIDLNQNDCPPTYETVVQQSIMSLKRKGLNYANRSKHNKNNFDGLGKYSPNCEEFKHNTDSIRNSEPLISSTSSNCISTISTENSSLIDNRRLASTSSPEADGRNASEECTLGGKNLKDEFKLDSLRNVQLVKAGAKNQTYEKLDIVPRKTVECENEIALLDASGLPSYDTALKIQECGNI